MNEDIRALIVAHPRRTFLIVCPLLALFTLSSTPGFIPVVALLTSLRLWTWVSLPRPNQKVSQATQVIIVALAAAATQLAPSLEALSTPTTSLLVLSLLTVFTSAFAFATFFLAHHVEHVVNTPWSRLAVFPALWATAWNLISRLSPMGYLASWSPVLGLGAYDWIREFFGQAGVDWAAAAWAVVFSELVGDWLVAVDQHDPDAGTQDLLVDTRDTIVPPLSSGANNGGRAGVARSWSRSRSMWSLAAVLITLTIPSYFLPSLPLPPESLDTTPFTVGCALPVTHTPGKYQHLPTLWDFIVETRTIQAQAPIVIWPEDAVRFNSPEEKQAAFERIQHDVPIGKGRYVGVSFEDYTPARVEDGHRYPAARRNGFAMLGWSGPPVMEYYKHNLVPIAESFSLTPGHKDPAIFTMDLARPKSYNKTEWAPGPNYTRPIPVTASICFDFASPTSFAHLESKPALIFAPAKTWHTNIGLAMWEQAKARAKETGSVVVWCDGGAGGVSGVASRGHEEIFQVGQGTWTRTVGLQWPFDEHHTIFIWGGQYLAICTVWSILGVGWVVEIIVGRRVAAIGHIARGIFSRLRLAPKSDEERPLLHD